MRGKPTPPGCMPGMRNYLLEVITKKADVVFNSQLHADSASGVCQHLSLAFMPPIWLQITSCVQRYFGDPTFRFHPVLENE